MIDNKKLCNKLKGIMQERGFRQSDLADKLGITQAVISNTLSGNSSQKLSTIERICDALNVTVWGVIKEVEE